MTGLLLTVYAAFIDHYEKKWKSDRIDRDFQDWENGQEMRKDLGYDDRTFKRIPKRKIKNQAARKKHGY